MMLEYKMERSGGKMVAYKEHYTTKTCSRCGRINRKITHEKVFCCAKCELTMDRDVNAARNIYLKNEHMLTWAPRVRVVGDAYSEVQSKSVPHNQLNSRRPIRQLRSMMASAAAAFVALLEPHDKHRGDVLDVARLTSAVIDACWRHECGSTTDSEILNVTLELLQRKQPVDVQVLLLRLVRVLKTHMEWSLEVCSTVLTALVALLLNVEAAGIPTIDSLVSLISEIVEERHEEVDDAVHMALTQWTATPRAGAYRSLNAQQLTNWGLRTSSGDVAALLRDGSRFEQDIVLKCLLVNPRSYRKNLVQRHRGVELMLHVLEHGSSLAKALALAFAKDAAIYSQAFRAQMLQQQHRQRILALGVGAEVFTVVSDLAVWGNQAFLQSLQQGEAYEQVIRVIELREDNDLARRLCMHDNLLVILSQMLSSRMDIITASKVDVEIATSIWSLLLTLLNDMPPLQETANVLAGTHYVLRLALAILTTTSERMPSWTLNALQTLCSPLLRTKHVRQVFIDSGAISSLVTLLAEQQDDTPLGRDLVVLLGSLAASSTVFADEIDQCGLILCNDNNGGKTFLADDQPRRYYQNLLLLYHDVPALRLGRTKNVDKAINALAVAELLGSQGGSDVERLLMIHFLHNELQLNGLDPVRCALDEIEGCGVVVNAVSENLGDFICVALYGPLDGRKAARRVLTVVARSDVASRRKLREYHSDSWLVAPEVLETEAETRNRLTDGAQDEEQVVYEYSDEEDEEEWEEEEDEDEEKYDNSSDQEGEQQEDLTAATTCERPATASDLNADPAQRKSIEVQDALASLGIDDDDWELI